MSGRNRVLIQEDRRAMNKHVDIGLQRQRITSPSNPRYTAFTANKGSTEEASLEMGSGVCIMKVIEHIQTPSNGIFFMTYIYLDRPYFAIASLE